ncbi:MAG TPA: MBL fold metallo-hydrolase [Actinomycetota bacterium]|nr:MBL fold metallo-hydrolase [Actinomycetota bacterium]
MSIDSPTNAAAALDGALGNLYASHPEALPFAPELQIRAFMLEREGGNLLIYSAGGLGGHRAAVERLGGISRHYLNHWHEALFAPDWVPAPLYIHDDDRRPAAKKLRVEGSFSTRHTLEGDFEVIPTPGHTPGATAYLWDDGEHRFLFTGDTIFLRNNEWVAAVLDSSDRVRYIESLELIKGLDFDVLVPWAASGGEPYIALTDGADAAQRIDLILERLRRGEDY